MIGDGAHALGVERAQGADVGRVDADLLADVAPQAFGDALEGIQGPTGHANEADVQRDGEPVQRLPARVDAAPLGRAVGE